MNNKKIIINADDCGMSAKVNKEIKFCIENGLITSTTIMANMSDFEGAVNLYHTYKDVISFGWHINLTEGEPLTRSQLLLDKGFFKEYDGRLFFNGKSYWRKMISSAMMKDIKKELNEQLIKLRDNGVCITHVDSHQHIHTSPGLFYKFPAALRNMKIDKCRRIRNVTSSFPDRLARNAWTIPFVINGIRMTDSFCSFSDFYYSFFKVDGNTIELMVHPGHPGNSFIEEYELLKKTDIGNMGGRLVTYRDW